MIEIASVKDTQGIFQKDIAINQNISVKYLDSIIAVLRTKGLIINAKGKHSGYKLARKPEDISVWEIYTAFESVTIVDCVNNETFCEKSYDCRAHDYWLEFQLEVKQIMVTKSLAQILVKTQQQNQTLPV